MRIVTGESAPFTEGGVGEVPPPEEPYKEDGLLGQIPPTDYDCFNPADERDEDDDFTKALMHVGA